jgi:tetratricopeptide (TPR) repeat protein
MRAKRHGLLFGCALLCLLPPIAQAQSNGADLAEQYAGAGQQALAAGQYAAAQTNFEKLAKLEPGIAEVHATLAIIYFKQREYDLAVREIHTAQRLKPGLPKLDSLLGMSLAEMGRFHDALPGLEKGFKQSADSEIRRMCGLQLLRVYTGLNRDPDAVETALALNKYYPSDPEVLYHTGRIFGNIAYVVMEKLHDEAPGSIWMLQAQGEANEAQKDYDAAIIAFNHILVLDPKRPGIHYRLGRVYLRRFEEAHKPEDRESAKSEFAAEVAVDSGNGNAAYELANIDLELGNLEEARKGFEQVIARFPDFEEALVAIGGIRLQDQKPELALQPLQHAAELRPDDKVAWYRLAQAERELGHKEASQKAMVKFQQLRKASNAALGLRSSSAEEVTPQQLGPGADSSTP